MKIHEYQGKELFRKHGIPTPNGIPVFSVEEALKAYDELATKTVVVKAQIHAGGRGKGGGVKLAHDRNEVEILSKEMLGMTLVTHQTGPNGKEVQRLLIESGADIAKEFYAAITLDRGTIVIASGGGGIPVHNNEIGQLDGLDAVIDKDYSAAKMGRIIRAQELWIITDVECVYDNFGNTNQKRISSITRKEAQEFHEKDVFQKGSIAPKIKAAIHFLKHHGDRVIITSIPHIKDALNGSAGTEIRNEA